MAISEELQNTIKRTFELSSTMLDQASILKQKVDSVESNKAVVDLQNRLIRAKARRDRANAEVRAYWAMMYDTRFEDAPFDIHGKLCDMDTPISCRVHTPSQWERIWNKVAHRLEVYCSVLATQCNANLPYKSLNKYPEVIISKD